MFRLAAVALVVASSAAAQSGPTIRTGSYVLEITFGGGVLEGTLDVVAAGDSLAVTLTVGDHVSPVRAAERRGNRLVLVGTNPGMAIRYELTFDGDRVTGTFSYDGQTGTVTGRRRAGAGD